MKHGKPDHETTNVSNIVQKIKLVIEFCYLQNVVVLHLFSQGSEKVIKVQFKIIIASLNYALYFPKL